MTDRPVFVVAGMHRSGTSLTMQALGALGLTAGGDLIAEDAHNMRGYWEASEIVALHDDLLGSLARPWGSFAHLLPLPADWQSSPAAAQIKSGIAAALEARLINVPEGSDLAIKDPRMSLFLPLWHEVASENGMALHTLICLRDPGDVARSLTRRDGMPDAVGRLLWALYTATAIRDADPETTQLVFFDDWRADPDRALAKIARFTGRDPESVAGTVFDPAMTTEPAADGDDLIADWQAALDECREKQRITPALRDKALIYLAHARHFETWARILTDGDLQKESSAALARDLESYRASHRSLRTELDEAAQVRDEQTARAKEYLTAYQTEAAVVEHLRDELEAVASQRDEQAERARENLTAYQAEAATSDDLRSALAMVTRQRDEQAAKIARLNPLNWIRRSPK